MNNMQVLRSLVIAVAVLAVYGGVGTASAETAKAWQSGQQAPTAGSLVDASGNTKAGAELWAKGPVVLVFYLGHW